MSRMRFAGLANWTEAGVLLMQALRIRCCMCSQYPAGPRPV